MYLQFAQTTSKPITRQELRKGIGVISEMETLRSNEARQTIQDRRYYRFHIKDQDKKSRMHMINICLINRITQAKLRNRLVKPTKENLESLIRGHAFFAYAPNEDWRYPCGYQDYLGERRDESRRQLLRLCKALKALNHLERTA